MNLPPLPALTNAGTHAETKRHVPSEQKRAFHLLRKVLAQPTNAALRHALTAELDAIELKTRLRAITGHQVTKT